MRDVAKLAGVAVGTVYPSLPELPLTRLDDLVDRLPAVAAGMVGGRWTAAAEKALLETGR